MLDIRETGTADGRRRRRCPGVALGAASGPFAHVGRTSADTPKTPEVTTNIMIVVGYNVNISSSPPASRSACGQATGGWSDGAAAGEVDARQLPGQSLRRRCRDIGRPG